MVLVDNVEVLTEEEKRLRQDFKREKYWKRWGCYTAERQWATGWTTCAAITASLLTILKFEKTTQQMAMPGLVSTYAPHHSNLSDYHVDFSHDQSRKRAYRWGEDGIAGVCDSHGEQNITFAFWNGQEYVASKTRIRTTLIFLQ